MTFHGSNNLRLEVERTTEGLPNLVQNPNGELGAWGYVTPVSDTNMTATGGALTFTTTVSQAAHFTTEYLPVTAGKFVAARLELTSITASHNIKVRFEWYDASRTLISSTAQSGALSTIGVNYVAPVQAPANTVFVQMRADLYNGTGNPSASASVSFNRTMVTWADTSAEIQTFRKNLVRNPSFEIDNFYWRATDATIARSTAQASHGTASLAVTLAATQADVMSDLFDVSPNTVYTAQVKVRSATTTCQVRLDIVWLDAAGDELTISTGSTSPTTTNTGWTTVTCAGRTAPSGAVSAYIAVNVLASAAGAVHYIDAAMMEPSTTTAGTYFDGTFTSDANNTYSWQGSKVSTNLFTNPSLETNLTGWTTVGGALLTRDTTQFSTGVASLRLAGGDTLIATNLIKNPSFDGSVQGWTPVEPTIQPVVRTRVVSPTPPFGTHALRIHRTGGQQDVPLGVETEATHHVPIVGGQKYVFSCYVRSAVRSRWCEMTITWLDVNGDFVPPNFGAYNAFGATRTDAWTRFGHNTVHTAPNQAVKGIVSIVFLDTLVNEHHYIDAIMVNQVAGNGYFDGSTPDTINTTYAWTGQVNETTSTEREVWSNVGAKTASMTVTGNTDYYLSADFKTAATARNITAEVQWFNSTGGAISTSSHALGTDSTTWTRKAVTTRSPAGAATATVTWKYDRMGPSEFHYIDSMLFVKDSVGYFDGATTSVTNRTYAWTGTAHNSTSTLTGPAWSQLVSGSYDYVDPVEWQDILGPTHDITITREALNVGTLQATVLDAILDPAVADTIRPGKRIRLTADDGNGYRPVFTGKVDNAIVTYDKRKVAAGVLETRITLTASDAMSTLASYKEMNGVGTIDELPFILEGKGVPWNVNGSGDQVTTATVVSSNDSASIVDQVAITRDSVLGQAWVDASNILQAWDRANLPTAPVVTFSDVSGLSYTDIDVDFNTETCINHVTVKWLRMNPLTGETEEVTYGPYLNADSIKTWGVRSATYTIHGAVESATAIQTFANDVLAANGTPVVKANRLTMPVRNNTELEAALDLELCSLVHVDFDTKVNDDMRIGAITHHITTSTWTVDYTFDAPTSVAAPQEVPSPTFSAPVGEFVSEVRMWAAATAPSGWLFCRGQAVSRTDYKALFDVIGTTYGAGDGSTTFNVPDLRDRFPMGAGNTALAAAGGAATVTLNVANLPPHAHTFPVSSAPGANTFRAAPGTATVQTNAPTDSGTGTAQPVIIRNPYLSINFIIRCV